MIAVLLKLAALFATLSLLAFGSANSVIPDMQRAAVDTYRWMTEREFLQYFAISRIAPGPGALIVTLVGQKAAGWLGAVVATAAMFGPSCLLVHLATRLWQRTRHAAWRARVERGLAPVAIGLIVASGLSLMRGTEHGVPAIALTLAATVPLALTDWHPLAVLAACGVAGWWLGL